MCANWLIKFQSRRTRVTFAIYLDGRVYVDHGPLIGYLKKHDINEISKMVHEFLPIIKSYGYHVQEDTGFITRFWDNSRNKRTDLKVRGWKYENFVKEILLSPSSYKRRFVTDDEFLSIMETFYGVKLEECGDED